MNTIEFYSSDNKLIMSIENGNVVLQDNKKDLIILTKSNLHKQSLSHEVSEILCDKTVKNGKTNIHLYTNDKKPFDINKFKQEYINFFNIERRFDECTEDPKHRTMDKIMDELTNENRKHICIIEDGKLKAFSGITIGDDKLGLHMLFTCGDSKHKGYATTLLKWAENEAIKRNKKEIVLSVYKKNIPACKLYEKYGFKER